MQKGIDSLKKFRQWDAPNEFQKLDETIAGAKEAYEKAVKEERDAEIAVDEVSFGDDEKRLQLQKAFENFTLKTAAAVQGMDRVELQKRIYQTYNYPDQLSALQKAVERAELDLQKTKLRAAADIEKAEKDLEDASKNVEKIEEELKVYRKDLERCVIIAPASGILLYGQGENNRGGRQSDLKVGGTVFRGVLMTIPQAGGYKIDIEVGEHVRARLKAGNAAVVTFEAIPNLDVKATLKEISRYATRKRSWDENSPRAFRGEIELHSDDQRMISGLTGQVRIIVDTVENCLAVPIESVFNEDGLTVCYVSLDGNPDRRVVKTGRSNDDYVEITDGLAMGEKIYVDSPDSGAQKVEPEPVAPPTKS